MSKSAKSTAEQRFAAVQKKEKQTLQNRDKLWQEQADQRAKLKALRLAKEAADREAAETAAAEKKSAAKT